MKLNITNVIKTKKASGAKKVWNFHEIMAAVLFDYLPYEKSEIKELIGDKTKVSFDNARRVRYKEDVEFFDNPNDKTYEAFSAFCKKHSVDVNKYVEDDQFKLDILIDEVTDYLEGQRTQLEASESSEESIESDDDLAS